MRIAHVTMARVRGGVARSVEVLAGLQAVDGPVLVITAPGLRPSALERGIRWEELSCHGNSDVRATWTVLRLLRAFRPDAVLLHACAPGELVLLGALSTVRWPTVLLEHLPEYQPLGRKRRNRLYARLARLVDRWLAVSEAGARVLEKNWQLSEGTIGTVHLGVPEPPPGLSGEEMGQAAGDGPLLLAMGVPEERKGFPLFCTLAERFWKDGAEARWIWVGGSATRIQGAVKVLPWTSHVGGWLRAADLLLIPSRAEGLPLVLMEALACGTPVVASRVGGIPEALEDGVQGVLLPEGDREAWETALKTLLADPDWRFRMASAARRRWEERFTAKAMNERLMAELKAAVRSREGGDPC